ncbi:MAG: thiosulfate oxidation carrier complex protein SoxZ [Chloroflexi bacterium]|nr:thiosulfate oxidation carrier complex protein SoxZ [Chloroflexota bacterium]MBI5054085.1 thiosulfate oxidation carrier complex protein SoxZ [Chloroflexota bacterium]MBI5080325.1 thiosulfate oxidation carrier complex protein SoxZ [Chloroflexota bacterium]MBI5350052.1 thiosulfate oxidation carrier complex protein SoxZ [Chloroflexota bacterium]MBI5714995.1 thiosulfate oxidation carrier complex protein SoxZ [Chloroflexota bacterium]
MSEFDVQVRLPEQIKKGDIIETKIKIRHDSTTGLKLVEDAKTPFERFVRDVPAVYVKTVEVFYGTERINVFELNSSTSDSPLLAFKLKASQEAVLRVVVTNHLNKIGEATTNVKFAA